MSADYSGYFTALAGVSGALIGLLFVAITVSPERTIREGADEMVRENAAGAFLMLSNVLFVCLAGLIPGSALNSVVLIAAVAAVCATVVYVLLAVRSGVNRGRWALTIWIGRRVLTLVVLVWELVVGIRMYFDGQEEHLSQLAVILLVLTIIGLDRAWALLGGTRHALEETPKLLHHKKASKGKS